MRPTLTDTSWGHKYFSLLFPDRLDQLHNANYQRYHLVKLLQEPPAADGRYVCAGRFVTTAEELDAPINHLMSLLYVRNGSPHYYWRVGTSDGKQPRKWWGEMRDGGFVAVGWPDVGDLSSIGYNQSGKDAVRERMSSVYPGTPQAVGRSVQQLFYFAGLVAEGDIVLASDGATTLGIGRVTGGYFFAADSEFPHRRPVEWLSLEEWRPAKPEGLQTTLHQIRGYPNLIEAERWLLEPQPVKIDEIDKKVDVLISGPRTVPPLPGIPGRIQAVLERKRQVILYGPPGTGKTYWARLSGPGPGGFRGLRHALRSVTGPNSRRWCRRRRRTKRDWCACAPSTRPMATRISWRATGRSQTNGQLAFERRDGIFKRLCDDAAGTNPTAASS